VGNSNGDDDDDDDTTSNHRREQMQVLRVRLSETECYIKQSAVEHDVISLVSPWICVKRFV
jgi:hypothetical protein